MPHRTITSSNHLRDFTAGTIRSSRGKADRGKVDACVYTREASAAKRLRSNGLLGNRNGGARLNTGLPPRLLARNYFRVGGDLPGIRAQ